MPNRFINVGPADGSKEPILRIKAMNKCGQWVSVIRCWGTKRGTFLTNTHNVKERQEIIPFAGLPKIIQDAIFITRLLEFRFLWVDSLCTLQNSHKDWVAESANMGYYYRISALTIAVDSAASDSESFLFERILMRRLENAHSNPLRYRSAVLPAAHKVLSSSDQSHETLGLVNR